MAVETDRTEEAVEGRRRVVLIAGGQIAERGARERAEALLSRRHAVVRLSGHSGAD